ncbi:hypothetical protein DAMA08_034160 [Martiniozyma asiatica (nom. inval.)]|nr:hypothetical protein DAMA08_034160 [Martiniozyma asiatica]
MEKTTLKKRVFRCRTISSCQRCFQSKRKCSKEKPECTRCERLNFPCVYFTSEQLEQRKKVKVGEALKDIINIPDTVITPQPRISENTNFKLIVNSTGEYSKYFPMCLFPFYEHSSNVSWVVDNKKFREEGRKSGAVFDFNVMYSPIDSLDEIKKLIPPRKITDELVYHFFKYVLPIVPIVDKEEFIYKYSIFCNSPKTFNDLNSLLLLFAIMFCSSTSIIINKEYDEKNGNHCESFNNFDYFSLREDCFQCIENLQNLLKVNVTPSLSSLTSLALIYYVGSMNGYTITVQVSSLAKLAQIFGLHRTISNTTKHKYSYTPLRKLVYSFIWLLDVFSSYYTGLPPVMHSQYYEGQDLFPCSNDVSSLFLLARLCNGKVWSSILCYINKIKNATLVDYNNVELLYNESVSQVNEINARILASNEASDDYLKWLVTETRLGLAKSAMLFNVFRHHLNYVPDEKVGNQITTDLALHSLCLINESLLKFLIGMRVSRKSLWYNRLCFPFQAMYVVLSHYKQYPDQIINLSDMPSHFQFTLDPELGIDLMSGDIRMSMANRAIEILKKISPFWYPTAMERFEKLVKFKDFVADKVHKNKQKLKSNVVKLQNNSSTELINYNLPPMSPNSAYTFLDDGLQFLFGDFDEMIAAREEPSIIY